MSTVTPTRPRRDTLNLRISVAEETLLDRALMVVSLEAYNEFIKRLDQPAQSNARIRRSMQAKAPWKTA